MPRRTQPILATERRRSSAPAAASPAPASDTNGWSRVLLAVFGSGLLLATASAAVPLARRRRGRALVSPATDADLADVTTAAPVRAAVTRAVDSDPDLSETLAGLVAANGHPDGDKRNGSVQYCEITLSPGHAASRFYASVDAETTVAASPAFPAPRGQHLATSEAARDAHAALLADLETQGWVVDGIGGVWYATQLRREAKHAARATSA